MVGIVKKVEKSNHQTFNALLCASTLILNGCNSESPKSKTIDESVIKDGHQTERFKITTSSTWVIDSVTGGVWRVNGPPGGPYHFVRVCYMASDGKSLMPTPYEEKFVDDLGKFQKACKGQ